MFSLSCIFIVLIAFGANAQINDGVDSGKGYPFGKLRLSDDGKTEELIPSNDIELMSPLLEDEATGVQPLSSPCTGSRPLTKLAYPKDKSKFVLCRDEFHYEIISCPPSGEFNEQTGVCNYVARVLNRCERERPCLNDGQCQLLTNTTFKCNCRKDWTGERCETPLTTCATKPCGPGAECRILKVADYEQDYVCICHGVRGYGLNCQEVVPNPCSPTSNQFYSYAFSQRAYIQCDADLIHFQPCGPTLYWNQAEKFCDRKRPPKPKPVKLMSRPTVVVPVKELPQEKKEEIIVQEEIIETTTTTTTQIVPIVPSNSYGQKVTDDREPLGFIPTRVVNHRPHLLPNVANQQNQQLDMSLRTNIPIQSGLTQQLQQQEVKQQWAPQTVTLPSTVDETEVKEEIQPTNFQQHSNQAFGSKQWLNQVPDMKTQGNQRLVGHQQSWQGAQSIQNQPTPIETPTLVQSGNRLQGGFATQNIREQESSWKSKPIASVTDNQALPTNQWQGAQTLSNQQRFPEQTAQTNVELTGVQGQNSRDLENTWQNRPVAQLGGSKLSQATGFNTQHLAGQQQTWQNAPSQLNQQSWQNKNTNQLRPTLTKPEEPLVESEEVASNEPVHTHQFVHTQRPQTINSELPTDLNNGRFQKTNPLPIKQETQIFGNQQWSNRVQDVKETNNQRFVGQLPQSWENKNTNQLRPTLTKPEEPVTDSSEELFDNTDKSRTNQFTSNQRSQTTGSELPTDFNTGRLQQTNQLPVKQEGSWQGNTQKFPSKPHPDSMLVFKPTGWTDALNQETMKTQSWSQNTQSSVPTESSQFGLNQHQKGLGLSSQNTQSWSNNQQISNVDETKMPIKSDFTARPLPNSLVQQSWSQSGNTLDSGLVGSKTIPQWQTSQQGMERKSFEQMPSQSWQTRQ